MCIVDTVFCVILIFTISLNTFVACEFLHKIVLILSSDSEGGDEK